MQDEPGVSDVAQASVHGDPLVVGVLEIQPVPIDNKVAIACDSQASYGRETRIQGIGKLKDFEL